MLSKKNPKTLGAELDEATVSESIMTGRRFLGCAACGTYFRHNGMVGPACRWQWAPPGRRGHRDRARAPAQRPSERSDLDHEETGAAARFVRARRWQVAVVPAARGRLGLSGVVERPTGMP